MAVANDRSRNHDPETPAETLHEAERDQRPYGRGDCAQDARDGEPGHSGKERRTPAARIAQRTADELADCQPEQARRERQLYRSGGPVQISLELGKCGQVGVDRKRAERDERSEDRDGAARSGPGRGRER